MNSTNKFQASELFKLRGCLPRRVGIISEVVGVGLILVSWQLVVQFKLLPIGIFPSPLKILSAFPELHYQDALVRNVFYSLKLNIIGNLEAVALALPLGFIIGLFPVFRAVSYRYIVAVRYLALTLVVGIFISMFGIFDMMKIQFLAFSIFIYLLPTVIQRIDETQQVYIDTIYTLGARRWKTIRHVFIPDVLSRVYPDIVNLAALSWTYITIAEVVNTSSGGVGALSFISSRQSRIDKTFSIIIVILVLGFIIDKILLNLGKILFPYIHLKKGTI